MINEEYIEHLKNTLGEAIKANIPDASYSFHNEFYYDDNANINITVKALPGQIQLGVAQYPMQLMIECNDKFKDDLVPVLDAFALQYNEQTVTLDGADYREYYSTSTVVGTFQNRGTIRNVALTMEVNIISFDNFFMGESKTVSVLIGAEYKQIQGALSVNYKLQCNYDGAVGSSGLQRNYLASINEVITIDGLKIKNDTARLYFKQHSKDNTTFTIKYFDGETTETLSMKLVSYDDNGVIGNKISYQISLIQRG